MQTHDPAVSQGKPTPVGYREEQKFRQPWISLPVLVGVGITIFMGFIIVKQLVLGQPVGDRPMSNVALAIVGPLVILFSLGMGLLFVVLKLVTEVRDDVLLIDFRPFVRREIRFTDITYCEARTYRPIREYGGWGVRFSRKGTAYNVSGNRGVQLQLASGKRILIGSQRANELAQAIRARMNQGRS